MNNELLARLRDLAHYDRATIEAAINALSAPSATAAPPEEIEELGKYVNEPCGEGITLRRQWWSGGTWLEKGDRVVVLRPRMKGEPDRPDWARQLPGAEIYDRDHGYDRTASLNAGHYVCLCGGACSHYTTGEKP
jgi:hypothetical protein